ncbi:hypothetical protein D3C72_1174430 [compost metagenome]
MRLEAQALEQIQRQLEAVGFFGVDVQADVVLLGQQGQRQQARVQLIHHALVLGAAVARVQGRQLDGNARAFINPATVGRFADRVDGLFVRGQVLLCVVLGECGFTQHVVGIAEALGFELAGVGQGFGDGFAGHELLAHQAHGHVDALADHRLAALADDAGERGGEAGFVVGGHQLAGQQQAPGGGVDEQRRALAQVRLPVGAADLVADQRVARGLVGNAQQRFGQAHQRHAFLRRQRKFLDQALHQPFSAGAHLLLAQALGQRLGHLDRGVGLLLRQAGLFQQHRHAIGFRATIGRGNRSAQHGLRLDTLGEFEEWLRGGVARLHLGVAAVGVRAGAEPAFVRQMAALDLLQIREDRLLDQPVRGAVDRLGNAFEAVARGVVELDAEGGGGHASSSPKSGGSGHAVRARCAREPRPLQGCRDITLGKLRGAT